MLKPHGVWAVISPFNFPLALSGGPSPARCRGQHRRPQAEPRRPAARLLFREALHDAGVPDGVFNFVTGSGETVGAELEENPGIDGIVFTGSYEVGLRLYKSFTGTFRARASPRWAARTRRS